MLESCCRGRQPAILKKRLRLTVLLLRAQDCAAMPHLTEDPLLDETGWDDGI
jgi:hypothetical protein